MIFRLIAAVIVAGCLCTGEPLLAESAGAVEQKSPTKPVRAKGKAPLPAALVTEIKHWTNPDSTRITVAVDREAEFETHTLRPSVDAPAPSRIYIDIKDARVAKGVKDDAIADGFLKTARVAQYRPDVVRVVLDIENIKDFKVFSFNDPFRIVIDVKGERKTEISRLEDAVIALQRQKDLGDSPSALPDKPEQPSIMEKPLEKAAEKPVLPKLKPGKIRRIVVDPGHGGHDPGAIGPGKTMEKDVVLAIGLKLAERLKGELGLDVVMTRSTDIFIPLEERTAIANKVNADLFVSIHANASLNRNATGIETYYLNLAKTQKVKELAARENNTSLEKVSVLQAVLFDLMANSKINDSAHLAEEVQKVTWKRVSNRYPAIRNNGVKQGPFYVLVGATMPSILVETAFISNETEEKNLIDPQYQDVTVDGIVEGVRNYAVGLKEGAAQGPSHVKPATY